MLSWTKPLCTARGRWANGKCFLKRFEAGRAPCPLDPTKITDAIFKAVLAVGGSNREIAENLTWQVIRLLKENSFNA